MSPATTTAAFKRAGAAPEAAAFIASSSRESTRAAARAALGRRVERRRELLVHALRRDALDVVPVFPARIDRVVAVFVLVRLVGRAGAEDRILVDLRELALLGVAAID